MQAFLKLNLCDALLTDDKCLIWKRVALMVETQYFGHTSAPDGRFLERYNTHVLFKQLRVTCYCTARFLLVWKSPQKICDCSVKKKKALWETDHCVFIFTVTATPSCEIKENSASSSLFSVVLFQLQGSAYSLLHQAWATPPGSAWSVSAHLLRPIRCDY